ncbi:MAG: cation-translocating P-type ATPase [Nitrososphaerota archaeon]|jgi:Ca2+-transporting ATPase|nr:cation-translocating P-type ATPase [Nitrososphaerota archaeon]
MTTCKPTSDGLTTNEAKALQLKHGKNELSPQKKESTTKKALHTLSEPMFLLLIIAAILYFILGEPRDGTILLIFAITIISIDIIQEWKTDKTLNTLKDRSTPPITAIRDGKETQIASLNLVPGDIILIQEGTKIPADGFIINCNDLYIDESSLTGEPEGIWKTPTEKSNKTQEHWRKDYCYAGTHVIQGSAVVYVDKIGQATEYGKIRTRIAQIHKENAPLQKQTGNLVKLCVGIAAVLFALVSVVTWLNIPNTPFQDRFIESILSGITIAMAMIPEEFPVILTVFLSMGAWRLAKKKSLVRKLPSVETLGAVSVLCVDKTGTVTMNQMTVQETWAIDGNKENLAKMVGLACKTNTYDPVEKAMLAYCEKIGSNIKHLFGGELISEYAFTNELKMMGHIWRHNGEIIIAAKGAPERILTICQLTDNKRATIEQKIRAMSEQGLGVIAVATANLNGESGIPKTLTDCTLVFWGLIGLADPPRESVENVIAACNKSGIRVIMVTGDNGITAAAVAKKIGMKNSDNIVTGDMLEKITDDELCESIKTVSIFSRVVPEHKMRIVKAFKDNGEIVAMMGDGVNDALALKYADIGIAMGKRGSEVSREAADLILMDDNFSTIIGTIEDGRRIYDNIRKADGHVFAIYLSILLASLLAPLLGIYPASLMLLPLHVVLLKLVIDPACSVVFERQPAETSIMEYRPRNPKEKILDVKTLAKSVTQGLVIFAVSFGVYYFMLSHNPNNAAVARSMGLAVIMLANLFLVQVNSSNVDNIFSSIKRLTKDKVMWAVNVFTVLTLFVILYTPLNVFLKLAPLSIGQILTVLSLAAVSVLWYEIVKLVKKNHIDILRI